MINPLDKIISKNDNTVKFIFPLKDNMISEVSYINKNDGKDILCVSTQTACKMGCRFCHTTDVLGKLKVRNLGSDEMYQMVKASYRELRLEQYKLLLVSYMGCGEPLLNWENVLQSMLYIRTFCPNSRFAIATMLPKTTWENYFTMVKDIEKNNLNVKIHLSLHYTDDIVRSEWMPRALPIGPSVAALEFFKKKTGNSVEIHYALIDGINDSEDNAKDLATLLKNRDIPVKFLQYNKRESLENKASSKKTLKMFMDLMKSENIFSEYYVPPGQSIGASCGQFLMDYYLKYNIIPSK